MKGRKDGQDIKMMNLFETRQAIACCEKYTQHKGLLF